MSTQNKVTSATNAAENSSASNSGDVVKDTADKPVAKKKSGKSIYQEVTALKQRVARLELLLAQIYLATGRDKFSDYTEEQVKALLQRVSAAEQLRNKLVQPSSEDPGNDSSPNSAAPQKESEESER